MHVGGERRGYRAALGSWNPGVEKTNTPRPPNKVLDRYNKGIDVQRTALKHLDRIRTAQDIAEQLGKPKRLPVTGVFENCGGRKIVVPMWIERRAKNKKHQTNKRNARHKRARLRKKLCAQQVKNAQQRHAQLQRDTRARLEREQKKRERQDRERLLRQGKAPITPRLLSFRN